MTVTTTQPPASAEGCESGRRSFERFLLDGERHIFAGGRDEPGAFAAFFRGVPVDLRATIADYFRSPSWLSDLQRREIVSAVTDRTAGAVSAARSEDVTGRADSVVRESKSMPPGRVGSIDLFLEELSIDPFPGARTRRSRDSVFFDVTTVDARGAVATTGNRVCLRKQCAPAAFCDRVLATIEIDQARDGWPRTISFEVDALEGRSDRLPEMIGAVRGYLGQEIAGMLAARGGYGADGGVMPSDVAGCVDSHVRAWLDCFVDWFTVLLPRSQGKGGEVLLGSAQFTATLTGPDLDYAYRNLHTGRLIEISGHSLVRGRPMAHTFATAGEEWRALFRLGFRGSGTLTESPVVATRPRVAETAGMGYRG
jgi:hypothetical protein